MTAPEYRSDLSWRGHVALSITLSVILLFLILAFFIWSYYCEIDEIARAPGTVIPQGRVQVAQNLEGGIISRIYVREGDTVQAGQVLVKLDNVIAETSLQDLKGQRLGTMGAIARLKAEAEGSELVFPADLLSQAPDVVENEARLYRTRQQLQFEQKSVLASQLAQKKQLVEEARSQIKSSEDIREITVKQQELARPMAKSGVLPKSEMLALDKEVKKIESELQMLRQSIPRLEEEMNEIRGRIRSFEQSFREEVQKELVLKRNELSSIKQAELANRDRVRRTDIRSPVNGIVKSLLSTTLGSVIKPGDVILEIVPIEDDLRIEARVKPSDIAFIATGQIANIRITAYDSSIYGFLQGSVESIAADTTRVPEGEPYYRVIVKARERGPGFDSESIKITPGMVAEIDIITGKKTVLTYLLKPLNKMRQVALRER